ncbi:MAG TPA: hypothetical protein PKM25_14365, partial [Candidatus Ozemobacteraceae bacterium]|nr:hypothetical protein [Candidatus Ozemobacteraceae bacterium]
MSLFRSLLAFIALLGIALMGFLAGGYLWFHELNRPAEVTAQPGAPVELEIKTGSSPKEIASRLKAGGLIRSAFLFR